MAISLKISPRILPSISTLYNDSNRVIMEYIDNSLDSAELYFDKGLNAYKRPIMIALKVDGNSYKTGRVIMTDNCAGMDNIAKVVENVGDSDKKAQAWINGQFGYGIYSFMAVCSQLEVVTKTEGNKARCIVIHKSQFNAKKVEDVTFPDPNIVDEFHSQSGTEVILSEFLPDSWKQLDINELKSEIEKHFELILSRKELKIELIGNDNQTYICEPFDYEKYDGDYYRDDFNDLEVAKSKGGKIVLDPPIKVFIKVTRGQTINKNPVFIAKGRRIGEIKDIRLFRSKHKSDLWGHPNVTGYIDVASYLEPTIARTDFRNNTITRALFAKMAEIEPLIHDLVDQESNKSEDRHYRELEDKLNQALAKLAKLDAMNFRTDYLSGRDINLQKGGSGQGLVGEDGGPGPGPGPGPVGPDSRPGPGSGPGPGPGPTPGPMPGGEEGLGPLNKEADNPFEDTGFKGGEKKKSGFNIRIVDHDLQIDTETNKPLRSQLIGGEIRIYKKHPDFQKRVEESRKKEKKITVRLITYLAGEVTVHYKDKFYCKTGQAQYNKNMFIGVVEFIYQFEEMLKDLAGRSLSDIE